MKVMEKKRDGIVVLTVEGRVDGKNAPIFEEHVAKALTDTGVGLVIDCSDLAFISSAGLRVFLVAAKKLKARGRLLAVCGLQPLVAEIFTTTGLPGVMAVHPTLDAALGR